jgi:hypothetical protein
MLDGYFKRKSQPLRVYARHYFVRAGSKICTRYQNVSAVVYNRQDGLIVSDYEFNSETKAWRSVASENTQPGTERTWARCMEAVDIDTDIVQIETRLSEKASTKHFAVTSNEHLGTDDFSLPAGQP